MKRSNLIEAISILFIILFLYTGIGKLMEYTIFILEISESPILAPIASWIAWLLPVTEIAVAIILFIPKWRLTGLYMSLVLMTLFTAYIIGIFLFSETLPCSCGGILEELSWKAHLGLNIVLMALAVTAIILTKRKKDEVNKQVAYS